MLLDITCVITIPVSIFPKCVALFYRVGVTITYAANQNITSQIKSTRRLVSTNIRDLKSFANYTPAVSH